MAESSAKMLRVALLLLSIGCISAKRFSVMAPNVFHIGVKEKISVSVFDAGQTPVTVKLYLQDYPHRAKTFSQVQGVVRQGSNMFLTVKVDPQDLPDPTSVDKQYVYLVAKSDDAHFQFHKEAIILLSYKDGMIFIQTDKPIYTPKQTVRFRVIPLGFDMKPSQKRVTVVVQNPQGVIVEQWKDLDTSTGFISKTLKLGNSNLLGNWNITAVYGHQNIHNTSVQFEVREYVLPKFSVKLTVPPYILKTDRYVKVDITTRYVYDKAVKRSAAVKFSIAGFKGSVTEFGTSFIPLDKTGVTTVEQKLQIIQDMGLWFPEGSRLQVDVDVIETATGTKETATDSSCQFTSSPYVIKFKNTQKYFKPGLRFVVKVEVTYPNKKPAANVSMLISAKGRENNKLQELTREDRDVLDLTDKHGWAEFVVDVCSRCQVITIEARTDNQRLDVGQNAVAYYVVKPFDSQGGPLQIMARQLTPGKVGREIMCEIYRSRSYAATELSFAVVSRGRILSHNTTGSFYGMFKSWSFRVTREMSPSARLIIYSIYNNGRVVADSVLLNIEDSLPTEVEFPDAFERQPDNTVIQINKIKKYPGTLYSLRVKAPQGTRLGLLGVDQSVYLLRNKNRLTAERIFETAEELDLGCGVGGGKNSGDIFKNAGVVLMTENFVSTDKREEYGCKNAADRKKRSAGDDPADTGMLGRSGFDLQDFGSSDAEILDYTIVRSYFPETWIYDEMVVGPGGFVQMDIVIPDSITTWVIQAVAINNKTGLGLPTPLRIMAYLDLLVSLQLPSSVKRGEQVSLQATVFNYNEQEIRGKLFLKGDPHFCSIARDGERVPIGTFEISGKDAKSVAFPIVPKKIGEIEIEVSATFYIKVGELYIVAAGDTVRRRLLVVPEGVDRREAQCLLNPYARLRFIFGPGDTAAQSHQTFYLGETAKFGCRALGIPRPSIQWFLNDKLLADGDMYYSISFSKGPNRVRFLEILDIKKMHNGVLRCQASNSLGQIAHNITLTVKSFCEQEPISLKVQLQHATKSSRVRLICVTSTVALRHTKVLWQFENGSRLPDSNKYRIVRTTEDVHGSSGVIRSVLNIHRVSTQDFGTYICSVAYPLGIKETSVKLGTEPVIDLEECNSALGMESKTIPDESIAASSSLSVNHKPAFARLSPGGQTAWCSAKEESPYIQISLEEEKIITEVDTQGSLKDLIFVKRYDVKYLKGGNWISYNKTLMGNRNSGSVQKNRLKPPIQTTSIRIYPKEPVSLSLLSNVVLVPCLRLELYGCSVPDSVPWGSGSSGSGLSESGSSGSGSGGWQDDEDY